MGSPGHKRAYGKLRAFFFKTARRGENLARSIRQRFDNPSGRTIPAFLVGNVRSGTSMLVYQIARSPQVKLYNEDNPAAFRYWRLREPAVIDRLLERSHGRVTLFKPVLDTHRTGILLDRYPGARALFAFRHFDDVVNSSRRRFYAEDGRFYPSHKVPDHDPRDPVTVWVQDGFADFAGAPVPESLKARITGLLDGATTRDSKIALRWLFTNSLYFEMGFDEHERIRPVHYEAVVADPKRELSAIFNFLELEFDPRVTEGIHASSVGKDAPAVIDPEIRGQCENLFMRLTEV
jgi:hypothetical protein